MNPLRWFRQPRHQLLIFLPISVGPAAALGWLSWRLLKQDSALETQHIQEHLENAANIAAAYLRQGQAEIEKKLVRLAALPQPDLPAAASRVAESLGSAVLVIAFRQDEVLSFPRERLLYLPHMHPVQEGYTAIFSSGENCEYRAQDYNRAIAIFRKLSTSTNPGIRAGALVRLARNLCKAKRYVEALEVYDEIERLGSQYLGSVGLPVGLLARYSRCTVLEHLKRRPDLTCEAEALLRDLSRARWPIARDTFDFYWGAALRWLGPEEAVLFETMAEKRALSAAVENMWDRWQSIRLNKLTRKGRVSLWLHDQPVMLAWDSTPDQFVAVVAGSRYCEGQIRLLMSTDLRGRPLLPALADMEGHLIYGRIPPSGTPHAQRTAAELHLPWSLYLMSSDPAADIADLASRRRLLLGELAMAAVVLIAGIYFITRSVTRDLEVVQLKSDFVSAVSHEFRGPLTSMRQLTGMLAAGRVPSEEHRQRYYDVLSRETARLQRLVEGLLNFGRIEAGAMEYSFEAVDASVLVRNVVTDFQREVQEEGYRIDLIADNPGPFIQADPEAFSRALWNLLDNAVKYSPDHRIVRVELTREKQELLIRVQDRGVGISSAEQRDIFRKFVRGGAAASTLARGTGIGLAMADHIVRAHSGRIRVESEPGRGSTLTIVLPVGE